MPAAQLQRLISRQQGRVLSLERLLARTRSKKTELTNGMLKRRMAQIRDLWEESRSAHNKIIEQVDAEQSSYVADQVFEIMEEAFDNAIDEVEKMKTATEGQITKPLEEVSTSALASVESMGFTHKPKVPLPSFLGKDDDDWLRFAELFNALVHSDTRYSDAVKFHFLSGCLTDLAKDFIKNVPPVGSNYLPTWKALEKRFYDPNAQATRQIQVLLNLPSVKKESSAELQGLVDKTRLALRALQTIGLPVEHWDGFLVVSIASRLDEETRRAWESHRSMKEWNARSQQAIDEIAHPIFFKLEELLGFIESRRKIITSLPSRPMTSRTDMVFPKVTSTSRRSFHAGLQSEGLSGSRKCLLCAKGHYIGRCNKYLDGTTQEQRKEHIRRLRLCFNCLGKHGVKECPSSRRCEVCGDKHHTSLHQIADRPKA